MSCETNKPTPMGPETLAPVTPTAPVRPTAPASVKGVELTGTEFVTRVRDGQRDPHGSETHVGLAGANVSSSTLC